LLRVDFRRERMPGMETGEYAYGDRMRMSRHVSGLGLELPPDFSYRANVPYLRGRDLCARATFIAYDPSIHVGVMLRYDEVGLSSTHYSVSVDPARQAATILRVSAAPGLAIGSMLVGWQRHPAIALHQPIECELRAQGATLEARVAGHVIARVHAPRLGIGDPGLKVGASDGPGRAVCMGFEVREVAR
jgi:hypothetical protein